MPAEKNSRAAARKIKDKWKAKAWHNPVTAEMFNRRPVGERKANELGKPIGWVGFLGNRFYVRQLVE